MRRKKEATRSNKQTRQSNAAHPRQSLFLEKMSCLRWDSNPRHSILKTCTYMYILYMYWIVHLYMYIHEVLHTTTFAHASFTLCLLSVSFWSTITKSVLPEAYIHVGCAVLLCLVCLTLLAFFFLPSHLSFKNMYMYPWKVQISSA